MKVVYAQSLLVLLITTLCAGSPVSDDSDIWNLKEEEITFGYPTSSDTESDGISVESDYKDLYLKESDLPNRYDFSDNEKIDNITGLPNRYDFDDDDDFDDPDILSANHKLLEWLLKSSNSSDNQKSTKNPGGSENSDFEEDEDDEEDGSGDIILDEDVNSNVVKQSEIPTDTILSESDNKKSEETDEQLEASEDSEVEPVILNNVELYEDENASEELTEAIKSEQSSNVTQPGGFQFLNMTSSLQFTKGMSKRLLVKRVTRELNRFKGINEQLTKTVKAVLAHMQKESFNDKEKSLTLFSNIGSGKDAQALCLYYKRREDGRYNFKRLSLYGRFKLAATMVITRTFNATHSKDVISYIPRENVTEQQVKEMLGLMVPKLGKLLGNFLPSNNEEKKESFLDQMPFLG